MKESKKPSRGTPRRSTKRSAAPKAKPRATITPPTLDDARRAHIDDLRVLIDQGHAREKQLADMVRLVMEERFFRPVVTGGKAEPRIKPALDPDSLVDVATFDEQEDAAQIEAHERVSEDLEQEFNDILGEEQEYRAGRAKPGTRELAVVESQE